MSDEKYDVKIVRRTFQQTSDDYHATVTRLSDGADFVCISAWRWLLKWRIRRKALDREFERYDKHQKQLAEVERFHV